MDGGVSQVLQTSQEDAIKCIQLGYLLPELCKRKLLTDSELRQFSDEKRITDESNLESNRALMRLVEAKGGEKSFDLFVQALEAETQHPGHERLAKILRKEKAALKSRVITHSNKAPISPPKPRSTRKVR